VCLGHLGFGETGHQISLRHKAAVQREAPAGRAIKILGSHAQPNGGFSSALGPNHTCRPTAGARTERLRLEQHDPPDTALGKLNRSPRPDRTAADDDHIGMIGTGHSTRR
jgi:hypothetical protein